MPGPSVVVVIVIVIAVLVQHHESWRIVIS